MKRIRKVRVARPENPVMITLYFLKIVFHVEVESDFSSQVVLSFPLESIVTSRSPTSSPLTVLSSVDPSEP